MNEIRINKEEEKEIVRARFKMSQLAIGVFVICAFICAFIGLILFISGYLNSDSDSIFLGEIYLLFGVTIFISFIFSIISIKRSSCIVTNKRIYGAIGTIAKKKFSYRLDEIDNVEIVSFLGAHVLSINFSQGHGPQGVVSYNRGVTTISGIGNFRITCIANIDEVYEKIVGLLTSVKNDKDVMIDIEMSKVQMENRKATALENMASNIGVTTATKSNSNSNYIEELKGLKELRDADIISEAEFEEKKKNLLK